MQKRTLSLSKPWRAFGVVALAAVMTLGLAACGTDEEDPGADEDNVPNVSVTPLQPESEGTPVPRPQDPTGTIPTPTEDDTTPATSGEVIEVIIGDDLVLEDMTIAPGDSISWTNEDDNVHTIASTDEGDWGSAQPLNEEIAADETVTHQFTIPGEFPLTLDGGEVTWTVTVE